MQVLSSCVQARQGFVAPCRGTLEVLSSVPFWSPAAPLSSVPPASNADPFNPVCYLLSICRSFAASDLRSCVRLLQKMFAHILQQLKQRFQVTLEKGEHSTEIVLAVGEGSLASRSGRSLGGCSIVVPIGVDRGEE